MQVDADAPLPGFYVPIAGERGRAIPSIGPEPIHPGQTYGEIPNTSGQKGWVPPEVAKGWNWGGCLGTGCFWSFAMRLPFWGILIVLLSLINLGWIIQIVLGWKGNQWAWQNRRFDSAEHFKRVQQIWTKWSIALFVIFFTLGIMVGIRSAMTP